MLNLKFIDSSETYSINFRNVSNNIVEIKGEFPHKTSGFFLSRIGHADNWDYSAFTTIYKEIDGGVQYSNDGSVYVEPTPIVTFNVSGGGTLEGESTQEVWNYEDLVIPTPIANEDWEFDSWSPEIPENGKIDGNKSFTAIFNYTYVPEEPEIPEVTLEERVSVLEEDVKAINNALEGV